MVSLSTITGDIGSVLGLFAGDPVKLGDFSFKQFECPEKIEWGGKQQTVVHSFPGGGRVIDAMGQEDREITFSGILLGADATARGQKLNQMRIDGLPLILSWGSLRYTVVISNLELEYKYANQGSYSISCITTQVPPAASNQPTLLGSIVNDISKATGIDIVGGVQQVQAAIAPVQAAIAQITPFVSVAAQLTGGSPAALSILGAVNNAQNITSQIGGVANSALGAFGAGPSPFSATNPSAAASLLSSLGASSQIASATGSIGPYLGRMVNNLTNPSAS